MRMNNPARHVSLLTEVDDAGQIIWSSNADAAELVADAQSLEDSAEDYKALCAGEEIVQEAASEEAAEEEQESTQVASEDIDLEAEAEAEKSIMSSVGVLAPLAGLGLAGGGGGGGGSSSSSSTFLDEIAAYTYDANLDIYLGCEAGVQIRYMGPVISMELPPQ